ncbi:hypothetical protein OAN307_c12960 [Octadecabacter antarcticus 307]|uniref:Bacterial Ig-like domain-containing protein n=2 Tax=Octadecabacter TaxID=53945 RepID=M9R314_9RHOB|nr:hypothetical protein OAN307_c12960 [Octadecabacter antarcticus 307]
MRNWIRSGLVGVVVGGSVSGGAVSAQETFYGSAFIDIWRDAGRGEPCGVFYFQATDPKYHSAYVALWDMSNWSKYFSGGSYWNAYDGKTHVQGITKHIIADCLMTDASNVTMLTNIGANAASYTDQIYMGFAFRLTNAAGGLAKGNHEYFISTMPPPDTTAPTVTLTGPSEIVTGAFDVSAAFSEPVTGLMASEITVEGGSVTGLSGDDADYTITIEPVMGATVTVTIIANAAQDEANNGNIVSNTYTIQAGSPASAFEENEEEILAVVAAEALRGVRSTVSSNVRMTSAAQERFISGRQQAGTDSQMVSRAATPLDITGSAELSNGRFSTQGTFFGETGSDESGQTRLFFGDFDIQRDTDGSVSAQINGKLAWERQISNTAMYGYYLGAELGRATLEGAFAGEQDSFGASVGAYFVTEIQPNLYVDGFASLGVGRNSLELDNGTLNVASDYKTTTGTVGASLTGVVEGDGYELWPQLQLTYGQTHIGKMTFSGEAYSLVDDTLSLDAGTVSMASGTFTAEFKVPLDGLSVSDSHALFTFAPRVICERIMATDTTSNCGGGAEIGMVSRSSDGLSNLTVNIRRDRVGDTTTTGLGLNFERAF